MIGSTDVIDVVEHLVVTLKDSKKLGREECQMLLAKLDRARDDLKSLTDAALIDALGECDCPECRRLRTEE